MKLDEDLTVKFEVDQWMAFHEVLTCVLRSGSKFATSVGRFVQKAT